MSKLADSFNHRGFSIFLNSPAGRAFRVLAGVGFLVVGYIYRHHGLGVASMIWSFFPLSAGLFDVCYISAALGGPFSGKKIRAGLKSEQHPG
jgi:hypothetical protein